MNIYVGGLDREVTQDDLLQAFGAFGQVVSAMVIKDKFSGESRGFGFVEMPARAEAEAAMSGIREIKGRMISVNEARPREDFRGGGGARGGFGRKNNDRNRRGGWR